MLGYKPRADGGIQVCFFFFNDTATTEIYTLSLHDALPIEVQRLGHDRDVVCATFGSAHQEPRSEEHTSELQSRENLVCRLLLEKKQNQLRLTLLLTPPNGVLPACGCAPPRADCSSLSFRVLLWIFFLLIRRPQRPTLFPYTTLFR